MPRPRLALWSTLAAAATACSGSGSTSPAAASPDAGQIVTVAQGGVPRFVTPGAAAGTESEVTVATGGTVTWRFVSSGFNVVSGGGSPDGGCVPDGVFCSPADQNCDAGVAPQRAGSFYQRTFQDAGQYAYFSQPGCLQGMTGMVHVVEAPDGGDGGP